MKTAAVPLQPPARWRLRAAAAWQLVKRIWRDKGARIGAVLVALVVLMAVLAPLSPYGTQDRAGATMPPNSDHLLGTDINSFDVWSKLLWGARKSLMIGLSAVFFALLVGMPYGAISGFIGGRVDEFLMRVMDVLLAFPSLVLAIGIAAALGTRDVSTVVLAIGVVNVPQVARQVRASVLQIKARDFVLCARAMGYSPLRILFRHVMPNCLAPVFVLATLGVGSSILSAAGLAFLGLGLPPDEAEWGQMLGELRELDPGQWWIYVPPGVALAATVLGFNLLGDGLRRALDPRAQ